MATTTSASDRFPVQGDPAAAVKILLDTPAAGPSRDVEPVAAAFAQIIENSTARFAIGIFGDWGSGKTTLMNAIEARLRDDVSIIVPFNAWRFEREEHLLVPLLDTVRLSLAKWANSRPATDEEKTRAERARGVARRIGRVVRAFGTGLSAEVGAPGAKAKLDIVAWSRAIALAAPMSRN